MPDNVIKMPKKPKSTFKYVMIAVFGFLITMKISEFMMGESWLERKHQVAFFSEPIDISDNFLETLDGKQHKFSDFKGDKIILAFWAPWCRYCAEEMPLISNIESQLDQKGYIVIPLVKNIEPKADIENFYSRFKIEGIPPYITGDRDLYYKLRVKGFPMFVLVNDKGQAVANISPKWDAGDVLQLFGELSDSISTQARVSYPNP